MDKARVSEVRGTYDKLLSLGYDLLAAIDETWAEALHDADAGEEWEMVGVAEGKFEESYAGWYASSEVVGFCWTAFSVP